MGNNDRQNTYSVLGHAEINAILKAERYIKDWRLDGFKMYVTLEPCDMCSIIIKETRLDKVIFFVENGNSNKNIVINKEQIDIKEYYEIYNEFKDNIVAFFKGKR